MSAFGEPQFEVSFSPTKALALEAERASLFNWGNALLLATGFFSRNVCPSVYDPGTGDVRNA